MTVLDNELPEAQGNGSTTQPRILPAKATDFLRTKPRKDNSLRGFSRDWQVVPGIGYALRVPELAISFDLTRVRPKFDELIGLLTVRAKFKGALTVADDIISSADFNLSNLRARQERAKHLHERARAPEIDWLGLIEELCQRVHEHEARGEAVIPLQRIKTQENYDTDFNAAGLPLLRRLPTIWFGDGGCGKSYLSLYAAIDLAQSGQNVLYCDWEFASEDHAARLRQIVGPVPAIPNLLYRRCHKPLPDDIPFLKQAIHQHQISFIVCDSIGFACGGAPEDSDAALRYFGAIRELGNIGSLHIAHINKTEQGDQKPFGSVFWANGARSIWYFERSEANALDNDEFSEFTVLLQHRKANTGRLQKARAMRIAFVGSEVKIVPTDPIDCDDKQTRKLHIRERMIKELRNNGSMHTSELAERLEAKEARVRKTLERENSIFMRLSDGRIGLLKRA